MTMKYSHVVITVAFCIATLPLTLLCPCFLLSCFFPACFKDFNPSMISEREWLKANVYAAPVLDGRMSKLRAICRAEGMAAPTQEVGSDALLKVEGLPHG